MSKVQGLTSYLSRRNLELNNQVRRLAGIRRRQFAVFVREVYTPKNDSAYVARVDDFVAELVGLGRERKYSALLSRIGGFMDGRRGKSEENVAPLSRNPTIDYPGYRTFRDSGMSSDDIRASYHFDNPRVLCGWGRAYAMEQAKKRDKVK